MEYVGHLLGAIAALVAIVMIAIPERFFKRPGEKTKMVGPSYWGNYRQNNGEPDEYKCIESTVYPGRDPVTVGSTTYAQGRGVKE